MTVTTLFIDTITSPPVYYMLVYCNTSQHIRYNISMQQNMQLYLD